MVFFMRADYHSALLLGDACHGCWVREWGSFLDGVDWTSTRITDTLSRQDYALPEGACFMSTMRVYTREFRESAVGLVLSQGLSIRVAAEDLGMPYHTLHSWVRDKRRALRKTIVKAPPKTMVDAQARVRELEAEVRKLTLEKDILKKAAAYFAREQS